MSSDTQHNNGIGFCGLLTITFIVLKLCHVINWSWWLVLAPLWIPLVLVGAILFIVGILVLVARTFGG